MPRTFLAICCQAVGVVIMAQPPSVNLASGHRGLLFAQIPDGKNYTVAFACEQDPGFPLEAAYVASPHASVLLRETLSPDYVKALPSNFWAGWTSVGLFSFAENAAFDGRTLYRIEDGHIKIYPHKAQEEARKVYELSSDEVFLGAFGGRVFYWMKKKANKIYYRESGHTYCLDLHERVTEPFGVAKGDPKGELALYAVVKPSVKWYPSPRTFEWVILDSKNAKLIK